MTTRNQGITKKLITLSASVTMENNINGVLQNVLQLPVETEMSNTHIATLTSCFNDTSA